MNIRVQMQRAAKTPSLEIYIHDQSLPVCFARGKPDGCAFARDRIVKNIASSEHRYPLKVHSLVARLRFQICIVSFGVSPSPATTSSQPRRWLSNQLLTDRIKNDFGCVMKIEFLHQIGSMTFDGIRANVQGRRHVFVRLTFSK